MQSLMLEIVRRLGEMVSLLSCAANVVLGTGDREVTLSAGAWELRRRGRRWGVVLVVVIDRLNRRFNGPDHCARAWTAHAPIWAKIAADKASLAGRLEPS